jgi:putative transposase
VVNKNGRHFLSPACYYNNFSCFSRKNAMLRRVGRGAKRRAHAERLFNISDRFHYTTSESSNMSHYRRFLVPGGTYFFTLALEDRRNATLVEQISRLRHAWREVSRKLPFETLAVCVMPEHLHTIWTLPVGDHSFSERLRQIKFLFSTGLPENGARSESKKKKREKGIWQRRFWEHAVQNEEELERLVKYVYFNPVKHGWVESVKDWRFSSFHRDVKTGVFDLNWGGTEVLTMKDVGEELS